MATITKYPSSYTPTGTWNTAGNITNSDSAYTNTAPAKSTTNSLALVFPAFTEIPEGSTINSVTFNVRWYVSTTSSVATLTLSNSVDSIVGADLINSGEPTSPSTQSTSMASLPTATQLRTAGAVKATVKATRGSSNTAVTAYVDFVSVTVDYTPSVNEVPVISTTYTDTEESDTASISIPYTIVDDNPGLTATQTIDGVATTTTGHNPGLNTWSVGKLSEGAHTLSLYVTDAGGLVSNTLTFNITVVHQANVLINFEDGVFPPGTIKDGTYNDVFSTTEYPKITTVAGRGYVATNGNPNELFYPSTSAFSIPVTLQYDGRVYFDFFFQSEGTYDWFNVYTDDFIKLRVSGDTLTYYKCEANASNILGIEPGKWCRYWIDLSAGSHYIKFEYTKDEENDSGIDGFYVDNIRWNDIPATDHVTDGLAQYLNAKGQDNANTAWEATVGDNATLVNFIGDPATSGFDGTSLVFNGSDNYGVLPNAFNTPTWTIEIAYLLRQNGDKYLMDAVGLGNSFALWTYDANVIYLMLGGAESCAIPVNGIGTENIIQLSYNGTQVAIYVNGVFLKNYVTTVTRIPQLYIGCFGGGGYTFAGKLRLFRIYNVALTQSEIAQNYSGITSTPTSKTVVIDSVTWNPSSTCSTSQAVLLQVSVTEV